MKKLSIVALALQLVIGLAVAAQAADPASAGQSEPAPGSARSAQPQTGPPRPAPGPAGLAQRPEEPAPGPPERARRVEQTEERSCLGQYCPSQAGPLETAPGSTAIRRGSARRASRLAPMGGGPPRPRAGSTPARPGPRQECPTPTARASGQQVNSGSTSAAKRPATVVGRIIVRQQPGFIGQRSRVVGPTGLRQRPARFRQSGQRSPGVAERRPGVAGRSAEAPLRLAEAFAPTWRPATRANCNRTFSSSSKTGRPWARTARRPNPIASSSKPTVTTCAANDHLRAIANHGSARSSRSSAMTRRAAAVLRSIGPPARPMVEHHAYSRSVTMPGCGTGYCPWRRPQRAGVHGELVEVRRELVVAVEHLVVGDDPAGVGGHAAHRSHQAGLDAPFHLVVGFVVADGVDQVVPFVLVGTFVACYAFGFPEPVRPRRAQALERGGRPSAVAAVGDDRRALGAVREAVVDLLAARRCSGRP